MQNSLANLVTAANLAESPVLVLYHRHLLCYVVIEFWWRKVKNCFELKLYCFFQV